MLRRRLLQSGIAFALIASAIAATGCVSTRGPSIALEATAPDFTLKSHEGREVSLHGMIQNGPAVLVFYRGYW